MGSATHPWWKKLGTVVERLRANDVFDVRLDGAKPVTETAIAKAEQRLGAPLPPRLRAFYADVGEVRFAWRIVPGREHELGLDRSDAPRGLFELVPVGKLTLVRPGWVRFTNDGSGSGWAFAVRAGTTKAPAVGFYDHDAASVKASTRSLDELFAEALENGFAEPGVNEDVAGRIASGKLRPTAKKKSEPAKAASTASSSSAAPVRKKGPLLKLRKGYATALAIGATRAVIGEQSGRVQIVDLTNGAILHTVTTGEPLLSIAMVDDDIAIVGSMDAVELVRLDTGALVKPKEPFPPRASSLARVPGTRRVVAGGYTDLVLWDVDKAKSVARVEDTCSSFVSVDRSGKAYALGTNTKGAPVLRVWSPGGSAKVETVTGTFPPRAVVFGASGLALFPHEAGLAAFDVAKKKWRTAPPKDAKFRQMGAPLPNGDLLLTHPTEPRLVRLSAESGAVAGEQPLPSKVARSALAVSPDGTSALVAFGDGSVWVVPVPPP